ncbi:MAG: hypothetical protein PW843_01920 [Azospirillaceae bacterium]|nr:hypothetical protein [Azospirillaceae bacterium]
MRVRWGVLGLVASLTLFCGTAARAGDHLTVSVGPLDVKPGERVIAFHIHIANGGIRSLPRLPMGWSITVDNDASWQTQIEGSIQVGAAALGPEDMKNFLVVEMSDLPTGGLELSGEVMVNDEPGGTDRTLTLGNSQFSRWKIP